MTVTVLFLGGLGRSGTTLIERVLARADGVHPLGELVFLWDRGISSNERCGCGEPFDRCTFWRAVGKRAFGGWERLDVEATLALQRRVDRNRYLPLLFVPGLWPPFRDRLTRYAALVGRVVSAAAEEADASILVDSSKHGSTAAVMRHVPGVDARIAQVVRDPRGVAFSWAKLVLRPDATEGATEDRSTMARLRPLRVALRWLSFNVSLELIRRARPSARFRYEDVVEDPSGAVQRLLELAGHAEPGSPIVREGAVTLETDHTVAGNPLRFRTGEIEIRRDDEWRTRLAARDRRIVELITWPLRMAYGYR